MDHFVEYLKFLNVKKQLKIFGSFKENHLTNLAILIDNENRLSLLGLINKEEFKTLVSYGSVILSDKEKTRISVVDLEEFLLFHGF